MTPIATSTKANSVPMLVSSTASLMFMNADSPPTTTPVMIVVTCGVWYFGWIFAAHGGSRPSRAIEKKIRGWPSWNTRSTELIAITAPSPTNSRAADSAKPLLPTRSSTVSIGSAVPTSVHGAAPVSTSATTM